MILCEWDAAEGHPGQSCVHLYARILSTSFISVSILSVCCYSIVSVSIVETPQPPSSRIWAHTKALLVSKDRRHLIVSHWVHYAYPLFLYVKARLRLCYLYCFCHDYAPGCTIISVYHGTFCMFSYKRNLPVHVAHSILIML
jgi:hypothetical protein